MAVEESVATPAAETPSVAATTALAQRAPGDLLMSDDELRRTYRTAEGLAASGMWKDVTKAEQAFAKIILGRDLGLTPAQSMQGIQIVEGGLQMHYSMLGTFVRAREGYNYRSGWLKLARWAMVDGVDEPVSVVREDEDGTTYVKLPDGAIAGVLGVAPWEEPVLVWVDEEDPLDLRPIFGAVTVFTVNGEQRGVSRFTEADARQANLIKENLDRRAAWNTSRRNMLLARTMSNGVKWFVPEVMNGMPVYALGELEGIERRKSLTAPVGDGDDAGQGIDLGPKVEALIAEATEAGHRGLSNRAAVEMAIGQRAPSVVNDWYVRAKAELTRFKAAKAEEPKSEAEPEQEPEERKVEAPPEEVTGPVEQPAQEAGERADEVVEEAVLADEDADDPQTRLQAHLDDEMGDGKEEDR
jgi:hypothetical protein